MILHFRTIYKPCRLTLLLGMFGFQAGVFSQEEEDEWEEETPIHCFYDTRVINGHSNETLDQGTLDFRITHRFGNIATASSGRTLFGLDESTDIRIAFEYGITDELLIGLGRSKGFSPYTEFWDGLAKYAILKQDSEMPVSLSVASSAFFTSMRKSNDSTLLSSFPSAAHRFSYYTQVIVAKNLYDKVSLQLAPGLLHRNYVYHFDENTHFVLGGMIRYNFYKKMSLLAEYYHVFRPSPNNTAGRYYQPLGVAFEIKTYAHVFQLSFTNSEGIGEGQFIPYTASNWLDGEWRFGFTISREF